jgi:hypothetical protein
MVGVAPQSADISPHMACMDPYLMLLLQGNILNGFSVVQTIVIRLLLLSDTVESFVSFASFDLDTSR